MNPVWRKLHSLFTVLKVWLRGRYKVGEINEANGQLKTCVLYSPFKLDDFVDNKFCYEILIGCTLLPITSSSLNELLTAV
jgi:hypothetical protein